MTGLPSSEKDFWYGIILINYIPVNVALQHYFDLFCNDILLG